MTTAIDKETETKIRLAVKPGNSWALDELMVEICGDDSMLRRQCSEIVADEYRRVLSAMPRSQMRELYSQYYTEESDANKDWLLGEIVEGIEAQTN